MGDTYMTLFPADPRQSKPDWPDLRARLLERGFILEPRGSAIPLYSLWDLWDGIMEDRAQGRRFRPNGMRSLESLLGGLKNLDLVPMTFQLDCSAFTIIEFTAALQERGWLSAKFVFASDELFSPGPLYIDLSGPGPDERAVNFDTHLCFEDFGDDIKVICGEGLFAPPAIPGTDRVVEEWQDLMDRWTRDPNQQWIDPETRRGYGILDLDWDDTLAAGRCWLQIHAPWTLDGNQAAELLTELAGQPFRFAYCHI